MTELQVMAFEQMSTALAAFDRDHQLIDNGKIDMTDDPDYDVNKTGDIIEQLTAKLKSLCDYAGRSDL